MSALAMGGKSDVIFVGKKVMNHEGRHRRKARGVAAEDLYIWEAILPARAN
jgi:hypothetical protein